MSIVGLGFFTHLQLERLLGGGPAAKQQRRRLVGRGLLPEPTWLRVDRARLAIFPEFSLAALTASASAERAAGAQQISRRAGLLYATSAFAGLTGPLEDALRVGGPALRESGALGGFLAREAGDALQGWRDTVGELELELIADGSLHMDVAPVRVSAVRADGLVVSYQDERTDVVVPPAAAADDLAEGARASLDRVGLSDTQRIFLLGLPEQLALGNEPDELVLSLASFMAAGPARLPRTDDEVGDDDVEPFGAPLLVNRERPAWRGANTMTRVGAGR